MSGDPGRSGWWTPRALTLHTALVVFVPSFLLLGLWQLSRALHGNLLSWAYTFEWPFFAAYASWMWWKLVHEEVARCATTTTADTTGNGGRVAHPAAAGGELASGERGEGVTGAAVPDGLKGTAGAEDPSIPTTSTSVGDSSPDESAVADRLGWNPYDDEADPELAAYNRYLASLRTDQTQPTGWRRH